MQKLRLTGRAFFSLGILGLGVLSLLMKDFIAGRPPAWPAGMGAQTAWAYTAAILIIACSVAILFQLKGRLAASLIAVLILISFVFRQLPVFLHSSAEANLWALNAYKTLALIGGAWIIARSFYPNTLETPLTTTLTTISLLFLSLFFIIGGCSHFKYSDFVIQFIPSYIPLHPFFTYFCGVCLIAAGIGIWIPAIRRPVALLTGIMLLGWFLLLHIPRFIAAPNDPSDRMGLCESLAFSGIFFVLATLSTRRRK